MADTDTRAALDAALAAYGSAVYDLGYVLHRPDRDAVLRPIKDAAEVELHRAITAHVEAEVARRLADRDPWHRHVVYSCCGNPAQIPDGGARRVDNCHHCTVAMVTPDKARRLVEEFEGAAEVAPRRFRDANEVDRACQARTALLRALGVEA